MLRKFVTEGGKAHNVLTTLSDRVEVYLNASPGGMQSHLRENGKAFVKAGFLARLGYPVPVVAAMK
ncbi:hypothetical protein [Erwinia billingiae]|uniref:hypothetical protein n=1 Tax=Erwinia billingiae TaxID=182337 RepID=UPI001CD93E9D|nr:hypothetical protein [Erwinia billingiae]